MKVFVLLQTLLLTGIISVTTEKNEIILSDQAKEQPEDGIVSTNDEEITNVEPFVPTNEWQVVKKHQTIPAGLHVRINFQTGIREAKLMGEDEKPAKNKKKGEKSKEKIREALRNEKPGPKIILAEDIIHSDTDFMNEKLVFTKSHLKKALYDFKDKIGTKDIEHVTWSNDAKDALRETIGQEKTVEEVSAKSKFRTMDEIKADLEQHMGWNIKSDLQIMQEIIQHLTNENSTHDEKAAALDALEDYAHQIDNGKDLEKIGGLKVLVDLLNDPNEVLQEKAANVLGAAAQSNKEVQEAVLKHGGLQYLINMLEGSKQTLTQKKGLYSVSAVIRGDHQVQTEFVRLGGLKGVMRIIKKSPVNSLKVKAVTLLYDLIVEQEEVMQKMVQQGKKQPDERSPLLNSLKEAGWCEMLVPLLKSKDFDSQEKVIQALVVSVKACSQTLSKHVKDLEHELTILKEAIRHEDDADFKEYLFSLKEQLQKNVIESLSHLTSS